jgi:CubicO group peptidase (beta-lactamase class C family)
VALVSRGEDVHVEALGALSFGGSPMHRDSIFRIASMTKPITAAAAMILVEECKLRLDDPVDEFLPELASRKVLRRIDAPLDDVVPAKSAITLRDLLTFRWGFGAVMVWPPAYPIQKAMEAAGLMPGPNPVELTPDDYLKRLGALPLMHQPGEKWMYHTDSDVLGVLIARASGQSLSDFLRERIFAPLGMKDTDFHVPAGPFGVLSSHKSHFSKSLGFWYARPSVAGMLKLVRSIVSVFARRFRSHHLLALRSQRDRAAHRARVAAGAITASCNSEETRLSCLLPACSSFDRRSRMLSQKRHIGQHLSKRSIIGPVIIGLPPHHNYPSLAADRRSRCIWPHCT